MKKNKKSNKRTGVKLSISNRSKFYRSYKKVELLITKPGPSRVITYDKNGKVVDFNSRGKTKFSDTLTETGEKAMDANKKAKLEKKEAIKRILDSAGFEPTVKYSKKELKHFTRIVKNKLFVSPKPVTLTKEECKARFVKEKAQKLELLNSRKHISEVTTTDIRSKFKEFISKKAVPKKEVEEDLELRTFKYVIQRKSSENPIKSYDFLSNSFKANGEDMAKQLAKELAKKYEKDELFDGIRLKDSKDESIIFYPKSTLLAA